MIYRVVVRFAVLDPLHGTPSVGARWEWRQHPSGSCEAAGQDSARGGAGWGEEIRRVLRRPVPFQKSKTITGGRWSTTSDGTHDRQRVLRLWVSDLL